MELEKYERLLQEMRMKHRAEKMILSLKYANENNPYKIGDIVVDHYQRVKIEKIEYNTTYSKQIPICVYIGPLLKKNNEPLKNGNHGEVFQDNII